MPDEKNSGYRGFTEAQARAHKKYIAQFVEMKVRTTPERRETIQNAAASQGQSVNAYINQAIDERMDREKQTAFDNQVAEELATELGVTADEVKRAAEFSEAVDVIEARFPGSANLIIGRRDAAVSPSDGADGAGVAPTESASDAAQSGIEGR